MQVGFLQSEGASQLPTQVCWKSCKAAVRSLTDRPGKEKVTETLRGGPNPPSHLAPSARSVWVDRVGAVFCYSPPGRTATDKAA